MRITQLVPAKKLLLNIISVSLLTSISLGAIVLILKNPISSLQAQTNPTSYWNVERDGSNNLNFSFTNNSAAGAVGLQLLPSGVINSAGVINAAGAVNVGGIISTNSQMVAKQGFNTGFAGANSNMTGDRHYQFGYQEAGPWSGTFPDLVLGYHTGMKFGANTGWGGMKFYNDHPSLTGIAQLLSIGDGDNNVRVANNLIFPNAGYGITSPNNTASLIPNNGTYGAWRISGNRNGWGGIEFDTPYNAAQPISLMVGHTSQNNSNVYTGMHLNGVGWLWYAVGTDMYAERFFDKTSTSNYVDPGGTSVLNQVNATTIYTPSTGSYFPHPNNWNYIRGNSYIAGDTGVILANGNVGVGTTDPKGKFGVGFGNGDQVIFKQINDDGLGIQTTLNGQPDNGYGGHTNNRLTLQPTTGYVGIKSTYPTADLHIKQSDQSQWGGGGIKLERSSSGYARIFMGDDQQLYFFTNSNSHYCLVAINGSIPCASDSRLKKDIEPLTVSALEVLGKLKPRTYTWKEGGMHSAGFIAQEVAGILPEAVTLNNENGYYALSDAYFTPYIVKSIQELDAKFAVNNIEVTALKEQVTKQQSEIDLLKKELEDLRNEIQANK